jgi:hypothetical protein
MGSGHHGHTTWAGEGDVLPGARGWQGRAVAGRGGRHHKGRTCTGCHRSPAARECGRLGRSHGGARVAAVAGWTGGRTSASGGSGGGRENQWWQHIRACVSERVARAFD